MSDAIASIPDDCLPSDFDDAHWGLRIGGIFIILVTSAAGTLFPIIARRVPGLHVPKAAFDFAKYAGSGVIIATAFIHLMAPAFESLGSECLTGAWGDYPWAPAIAMASIFLLFFVEFFSFRWGTAKLKAAGFDSYDNHGHNIENGNHTGHGPEPAVSSSAHPNIEPKLSDDEIDAGYRRAEELAHAAEHGHEVRSGSAISQILGVAILEFGVIFHSIFIGLTLATDPQFIILFVVIIFHQTFEGLGLGSRLAFLPLPKAYNWVPMVAGVTYACVTPLGMAIGLGVRSSYQSNSVSALVTSGVLDAISAGILLWTGLVELLAHEFLFNEEMQKASNGRVCYAFGCMLLGCGTMALLGRWA